MAHIKHLSLLVSVLIALKGHVLKVHYCTLRTLNSNTNQKSHWLRYVKASYAQSVRSLPSSLTEAFSALLRFVSGKDRNMVRKNPKVSSMQKHIKIHKRTAA